MATKRTGIQVSLSTILQTVGAVVLSYMLNQLLGMEAKVKALEVRQDALSKELDRQAASIKDLWSKKKSRNSDTN